MYVLLCMPFKIYPLPSFIFFGRVYKYPHHFPITMIWVNAIGCMIWDDMISVLMAQFYILLIDYGRHVYYWKIKEKKGSVTSIITESTKISNFNILQIVSRDCIFWCHAYCDVLTVCKKIIFHYLEDYNSANMTDIHRIPFDYCLDNNSWQFWFYRKN